MDINYYLAGILAGIDIALIIILTQLLRSKPVDYFINRLRNLDEKSRAGLEA